MDPIRNVMNKQFLSLLVVLLCAVSASAYDFKVGNLCYTIMDESDNNYRGLTTAIIPSVW